MIRTRVSLADQAFAKFMKGGHVSPVSEWKWPHCAPFVDLRCDGSHLTPKGQPELLPEENVFAEAEVKLSLPDGASWNTWKAINTVRRAHLKKRGVDLKGFRFSSKNGRLIPSINLALETKQQRWDIEDDGIGWNTYVPWSVDNVVHALPMALKRELNPVHEMRNLREDLGEEAPSAVDPLAMFLFQLCGFDSMKRNMKLTGLDPCVFPFAGFSDGGRIPDAIAVRTRSKVPVLICKDQARRWTDHGNLARMFGDGLCCLYHHFHRCGNLGDGNVSCCIHIVRLMNTRVMFFRLDADGAQVNDICVKGAVPAKRMVMVCDVGNADTSECTDLSCEDCFGGSLCDRTERRRIMKKFASLRHEVMSAGCPS